MTISPAQTKLRMKSRGNTGCGREYYPNLIRLGSTGIFILNSSRWTLDMESPIVDVPMCRVWFRGPLSPLQDPVIALPGNPVLSGHFTHASSHLISSINQPASKRVLYPFI